MRTCPLHPAQIREGYRFVKGVCKANNWSVKESELFITNDRGREPPRSGSCLTGVVGAWRVGTAGGGSNSCSYCEPVVLFRHKSRRNRLADWSTISFINTSYDFRRHLTPASLLLVLRETLA